jgi:hypothetical protein
VLQAKAKVAFDRLRAKVVRLEQRLNGYGQRLLAPVKSKGAAGKSEGCLSFCLCYFASPFASPFASLAFERLRAKVASFAFALRQPKAKVLQPKGEAKERRGKIEKAKERKKSQRQKERQKGRQKERQKERHLCFWLCTFAFY